MPEQIIEEVSLSEFVYGDYLGRHNLTVVRTMWSDGKLHVWTEYKRKADERST